MWTLIRGEGLRCARLERLEPTQPVLGSSFHDQRPGPVRWKRSVLSSLRTHVQALGPRWWEEKTDCQRLPSDLHTCTLVHGLLSPHMPTKCGKKKEKLRGQSHCLIWKEDSLRAIFSFSLGTIKIISQRLTQNQDLFPSSVAS